MDITVQPFEKWGDLFIIQDYEAIAGHTCPDYTLSGVSPTNDDFIGEILEVIENFVSCNSDAIMVELSFLKDYRRESITKLVTDYLERNGYEDLESYENRLAFGKFKG
jgi:hypothetical protein